MNLFVSIKKRKKLQFYQVCFTNVLPMLCFIIVSCVPDNVDWGWFSAARTIETLTGRKKKKLQDFMRKTMEKFNEIDNQWRCSRPKFVSLTPKTEAEPATKLFRFIVTMHKVLEKEYGPDVATKITNYFYNTYIPSIKCVETAKYRSIDGSCNSLAHPSWGQTNTGFARLMANEYADGEQWETKT